MESGRLTMLHLVLIVGLLASKVAAQGDDITTDESNSMEFTSTSATYIDKNQNATNMNTSTTVDPKVARLQFLGAAAMEPEFQAALRVNRYGSPIIIIIGLVGNTLSFLVMIQAHNRRISTCIYLAALAVTDNGSLLTLGYLWVVTEFVPNPWSDAGCKIWVYVVFLMTAGSAFTLLVVTFDRCLAIVFPFRAHVWCRISRTRIFLVITYVSVALFYIPMALQSAVVDGHVCAAFAVQTQASQILSNINLIVLPTIPFFLILIMNIMIIRRVYLSKKFQREKKSTRNTTPVGSNSNGAAANGSSGNGTIQSVSDGDVQLEMSTISAPNQQSDSAQSKAAKARERAENARNHQLTVMLLLVSFAFLIIFLPISLRVLAYTFIDITADTKTYAVFVLLYNVLNLLLFTNNAINFYLYILSGSKFRSDLRNLFPCCKKDKSAGHSGSSNTMPSDLSQTTQN